MSGLKLPAGLSMGGAKRIGRSADLLLAVIAVLVIAMMVLPMPPWVLDILVAVNIASGITLLLFALYVSTPLAFSTFPSVLLFTTLFRIALNVATTRQILLHADAGEIIDTFGSVVVGGSLLVGMVIFLIITLVQFIVIAKGSERVAEVGARFTLDAMPGKQVAIDSDLRAGLISQSEALEQRRKLGLESQFFGSMDGAMKFVKGDAIASIVIVLINLLGGMAVGMLVVGMEASQAVSTYAVLSIGDGLVTQVPALLISMAAGIVVTRTSDGDEEQNLASQITGQFASQPRSMMLAGAVVALFALVPGFPVLPFLLLGVLLVTIGFNQGRKLVNSALSQSVGLLPNAAKDGFEGLSRVVEAKQAEHSVLAVEMHTELALSLDAAALDNELRQFRDGWRQAIGTPFPGVSFRRNADLLPGVVVVLFSETQATANNLGEKPDSEALNKFIIQALSHTVRIHAAEILGIQETKWLLARAESAYPDLVREAQKVLELPAMANLLASLVADGVPLRDMRTILEAIVDHGSPIVPPAVLTQRIRLACRRIVCHALTGANGVLTLLPLSMDTEQALANSALPRAAEDDPMQWSFETLETLADHLRPVLEDQQNLRPVLLTSAAMRPGLSAQLRALLPSLRLLAHNEIAPDMQTQALSPVSVSFPAREPLVSANRPPIAVPQ
ncbi:MAG: FHIPEP family type III secretion protein [Burkholderiaceae bacterium]